MTDDQKHTDRIATGQRVSRHSSRPDVFYFFPHRTFLKTILASRTSGTFGFTPTHKANPSVKRKEPLFANAPIDSIKIIRDKLLKNKCSIYCTISKLLFTFEKIKSGGNTINAAIKK